MVRPVSGRIDARVSRGPGARGASLSAEQKNEAREILSRFDPQAITQEDKQALKEAFLAAGIGPGEDLKQLFAEAGFDVGAKKKHHPEASKLGPRKAPGRAKGLSDGAREKLMEFLDKHDAGTLSPDDARELSLTLKSEGAPTTGWLIDIKL